MAGPQSFVYDPFDGPCLEVMGGQLRILFDGSLTGGQHSCVSGLYPPGGFVPPHSHPTTDELFVVMAGDVEFWKDGEWQLVPVGGVVFAQRGVRHGFRNVGDTDVRLVATYNPAGFEQLLVEYDALRRAGKLDDEALAALSEKYNVIEG